MKSYDEPDSFGYRSLTDWMSEAPLAGEFFFGGLGLFTVEASDHTLELDAWLDMPEVRLLLIRLRK